MYPVYVPVVSGKLVYPVYVPGYPDTILPDKLYYTGYYM